MVVLPPPPMPAPLREMFDSQDAYERAVADYQVYKAQRQDIIRDCHATVIVEMVLFCAFLLVAGCWFILATGGVTLLAQVGAAVAVATLATAQMFRFVRARV